MAPYFVLFSLWLLGSIQFSSAKGTAQERLLYGAALLFTTLMVGLRYRVGGDWVTYEEMYQDIALQPLAASFGLTEPAYAFLNWISAKFDGGVYVGNLGCAIVFMLGLSSLVRRQPNPWLAMAVAIPYLVIVVGMGYTRQAAAIGIICWAIATVDRDGVWKIIGKVAFAALFHKTAILFLPVLLAPVAKRNLLAGLIGVAGFVVLAVVALRSSSANLVTNYVNSDYQSSGATIRIAMNVTAAGIFFAIRKRLILPASQKLVWTVMSGLAVISIVSLVYASSSVGTDRLALFLIPLQVFVYGNLPFLPSYSRQSGILMTFVIIGYSFAVQYVYFVHGTFSYTWLPYRNILVSGDTAEDG